MEFVAAVQYSLKGFLVPIDLACCFRSCLLLGGAVIALGVIATPPQMEPVELGLEPVDVGSKRVGLGPDVFESSGFCVSGLFAALK
jgi:hypothetical protein